MRTRGEQRVVVVTGGGNGIGAAIATELGRRGDHVVTVDPLVSVDGATQLPAPEAGTAGRIVAEGGSATASNLSVTDRPGIAALIAELVDSHGRLDAVVNVAGITRPTGVATGSHADWAAVLQVHLDGYRNILDAALPHMAEAGAGHIVGVTSGSGWRAADAGAYSCAKRAVAALTWQLGRVAPPGVTINAISPIAMTRMVAAALGRARAGEGSGGDGPRGASSTGGLALAAMPEPEHLGPLGALLAGHGALPLQGQVIFAGGSEIALVEPPRLLEVLRTSDVASLDDVISATTSMLAGAERAQRTAGGANARFGSVFDGSDPPPPAAHRTVRAVAIVADSGDRTRHLRERLGAAEIATTVLAPVPPGDMEAAAGALEHARARLGTLDGVVTALGGPGSTATGEDWRSVLAGHDGIVGAVFTDAAWARATADHATRHHVALRLVQLVDATDAGGRSRAQAAAQLSRSVRGATDDQVAAFVVAVEADEPAVASALAATLMHDDQAIGLAGAELVVGGGWLGLRSHPRPAASVVFGGPELPPWFADVLGALPT